MNCVARGFDDDRWWREVGGGAVSFGSDAQAPGELARPFAEVAAAIWTSA